MTATALPGVRYWQVVEPIWRTINIHGTPDQFVEQLRSTQPVASYLFAAHWCQSEIRNGGFRQFFANSTGVLAPEALAAFRVIGLFELAELLTEATQFFGKPYPRDWTVRRRLLVERRGDQVLFDEWDERFFAWLHAEPNRWERAADRYAEGLDIGPVIEFATN